MARRPKLQKLSRDAIGLSEMTGSTCALAEAVSSKVRELDLIKGRLSVTIGHVRDILDLKACVEGVQDAMKEENYATAAAHVHRYLVFDKKLLKSELSAETGEFRAGLGAEEVT